MQLRKQNMQTVFHRQTMQWLLYLAAKIHPFKRWVCHKAALRFDPLNQSPVTDCLVIKERVAKYLVMKSPGTEISHDSNTR